LEFCFKSGIVAISFDEATRRSKLLQEMRSKMGTVLVDAEAKMPGLSLMTL
jgi:hypothetical protein